MEMRSKGMTPLSELRNFKLMRTQALWDAVQLKNMLIEASYTVIKGRKLTKNNTVDIRVDQLVVSILINDSLLASFCSSETLKTIFPTSFIRNHSEPSKLTSEIFDTKMKPLNTKKTQRIASRNYKVGKLNACRNLHN